MDVHSPHCPECGDTAPLDSERCTHCQGWLKGFDDGQRIVACDNLGAAVSLALRYYPPDGVREAVELALAGRNLLEVSDYLAEEHPKPVGAA